MIKYKVKIKACPKPGQSAKLKTNIREPFFINNIRRNLSELLYEFANALKKGQTSLTVCPYIFS